MLHFNCGIFVAHIELKFKRPVNIQYTEIGSNPFLKKTPFNSKNLHTKLSALLRVFYSISLRKNTYLFININGLILLG
ncbi:hypothetical protein Q766_07595 [Flavobacterium subsaxonicum WB 4.1-42 = DSM 21790]|uniref:Uncharacterized protein n=1 Tax=Flavobacterium subsaxonicum WB 4.1-42 = DSM 21790 TaxID=1121898 RepID=A0A0A2MQE4_9FLAO|nr:hypothetical protein Q766_07595 [Flavobacterium subsaxonicum WB 4.1-42 = DSM 21790]